MREFKLLHKHYYTPRLYVLESLFETTTLSEEAFLSQYDPKTSTLPVFANIHSESDNEQEASTSEEELSVIDKSSDVIINEINNNQRSSSRTLSNSFLDSSASEIDLNVSLHSLGLDFVWSKDGRSITQTEKS